MLHEGWQISIQTSKTSWTSYEACDLPRFKSILLRKLETMLYQICHEVFEHAYFYYFKTETTITNDTCTNQSIGVFDLSPIYSGPIKISNMFRMPQFIDVIAAGCQNSICSRQLTLTEEIYNSFDKVVPKHRNGLRK